MSEWMKKCGVWAKWNSIQSQENPVTAWVSREDTMLNERKSGTKDSIRISHLSKGLGEDWEGRQRMG